MNINLYNLLSEQPVLLIFTIILFGAWIGKIKVWGFEFGSTTGVLILGLLFGHIQLKAPPSFEYIGFILFIYCVGLQAGPQFFNVFKKEGTKYISLAVVTGVTGLLLALFLSRLFHFAPGMNAGILAGALTSTPTLVAAQDAIAHGVANLQEGYSLDLAKSNISTSYVITYIFGLMGVILFVNLLPRLLKINLHEEAVQLAKESKLELSDKDIVLVKEDREIVIRVYKVTEQEVLNKTLALLDFHRITGCVIQKVKREGDMFDADSDTELELEDLVSIVGDIDAHKKLSERIGPEILDRSLLDLGMESVSVVLASKETIGKTIQKVGISEKHHCILTEVLRTDIELPLSASLVLEKGDVLRITGPKAELKRLIKNFGHAEDTHNHTDMVTFGFGICAGILLGMIKFTFGDFSLSLGTAGGCLLAGLSIGYLQSTNHSIGRMPSAARNILMEFGMLFFMSHIGLSAGQNFMATLKTSGALLVFSGALVTLIPMLIAFALGHFFLRINPVLLLGAITGAMTSTPALTVITKQAKSPLPTLGYAGTYAFACVLLAIFGSLLVRL